MGSRCYDDTRLIGCGCEMGERGRLGKRWGRQRKRTSESRKAHLSFATRKRNKENVAKRNY